MGLRGGVGREYAVKRHVARRGGVPAEVLAHAALAHQLPVGEAGIEGQGEAAFIQASEFRGELDRVYVTLQKTLEAFAAISKTQADAMRAMAEPAKPKKWTFTIRRDSHGNIAALDAEQP